MGGKGSRVTDARADSLPVLLPTQGRAGGFPGAGHGFPDRRRVSRGWVDGHRSPLTDPSHSSLEMGQSLTPLGSPLSLSLPPEKEMLTSTEGKKITLVKLSLVLGHLL